MADDNRTKILDMAVDMIDAGGEAAIRVNHIVAAIGVTPPVLYHHFGSRDGLVIAAQVERYTREHMANVAEVARRVEQCGTQEELHETLVGIWSEILMRNSAVRWRRTNVFGSAYARPELEAAIARAQDEIITAFVELLEPFRERGWLREGIDLPSAVTWQYGLMSSRVFIEHGAESANPEEWDRLSLEAVERAFFGP